MVEKKLQNFKALIFKIFSNFASITVHHPQIVCLSFLHSKDFNVLE